MTWLSDNGIIRSLQVNLTRLIAYAESADIRLQREVIISHSMTPHTTLLLYYYYKGC